MDPSREETYTFLDGFIGEMAALFPDPYFHIGGDEVNGKQWKQSAHIQAFAKEHGLTDTHAMQAYFNQRIQEILQKHGKTMIGWDEILQPGPAAGHRDPVLARAGVAGRSRRARAIAEFSPGATTWITSARPRYHYAVDPLAGGAAQLTPEQAARILGGEACMWAELVDAGDRGFAHLAARRGHRRAALVAARDRRLAPCTPAWRR